jgi:hypothetical protein
MLKISRANPELSLDLSRRRPSEWKIPPSEVGSLGIKVLSRQNPVLWGILVYHDDLGQLSLSVELEILSLQRVCLVILNVVGNSENSHSMYCLDQTSLSAMMFVRHYLCSVVINQDPYFINSCASQKSNRFLNPNLFFSVLLKPCDLN